MRENAGVLEGGEPVYTPDDLKVEGRERDAGQRARAAGTQAHVGVLVPG